MGLIRPVVFSQSSSGFVVRYPMVNTVVSQPSMAANVTLAVQVFNYNIAPLVVPTLTASFEGVEVSGGGVLIVPGTGKDIVFGNAWLPDAPLWYPFDLVPQVSVVKFVVSTQNEIVLTFVSGLRQVTSGLDENGYRFYAVNNVTVAIRGAGWANELFLQNQTSWTTNNLMLAKNMGINMIRLEGIQKRREKFFFSRF
jgi:exo-1,4-beta-D-glucosaminidase